MFVLKWYDFKMERLKHKYKLEFYHDLPHPVDYLIHTCISLSSVGVRDATILQD